MSSIESSWSRRDKVSFAAVMLAIFAAALALVIATVSFFV